MVSCHSNRKVTRTESLGIWGTALMWGSEVSLRASVHFSSKELIAGPTKSSD